jgi:hypothetical protein
MVGSFLLWLNRSKQLVYAANHQTGHSTTDDASRGSVKARPPPALFFAAQAGVPCLERVVMSVVDAVLDAAVYMPRRTPQAGHGGEPSSSKQQQHGPFLGRTAAAVVLESSPSVDGTTGPTAAGAHRFARLNAAVSASALASAFDRCCKADGDLRQRLSREDIDKYFYIAPAPIEAPLVERIPRVRLVIWKTKDLPAQATAVHERWKREQPDLPTTVVTDGGCAELAAKFPGMQQVYESYPLNVMRADVCRVLAVYFLGGIYMDLDVQFERPLDEWFNFSRDLAVGYEAYQPATTRCNWFFAARAKHPCLRDVLELFVEKAQDHDALRDVSAPMYVNKFTGPGTFGEGLRKRCPEVQYSAGDLLRGVVRHEYASLNWARAKGLTKTAYPSWVEAWNDRKAADRGGGAPDSIGALDSVVPEGERDDA